MSKLPAKTKETNWTGQPTTSGDFSEHGSCANKGWRESVRSAAEPQAQTGPLCLLWSRCTRALIDKGTVIFPWLLQHSVLLKHRKVCLWRSWNPFPKQDPTWAGVAFGMTFGMTVSITPNGVCCGIGVVMSMRCGTLVMLKSTLTTDQNRATTSYSLPPEGHKSHRIKTSPNGQNSLQHSHTKKKRKKNRKSIYPMGFGWRLLLRSKGLKYGSWCTTRETKSFNGWASCTSLLAPDYPRGQRAERKLVAYCHGSLIRRVALCADKSRGHRFCCCFGCQAARRAC